MVLVEEWLVWPRQAIHKKEKFVTEEKQRVHAALRELDEQEKLTPENVVTAARDEASPLHSLFEWNDEVAAAKYRTTQARHLIAYYQIRVVVHKQSYSISEFVEKPLKNDRAQGYISVKRLVSNRELAAAFVEEQLGIARTYLDKAVAYAEVLGLLEEVEERIEDLDATLNQVRTHLPPASAAGASEQQTAG